jgi:hypothetical protein
MLYEHSGEGEKYREAKKEAEKNSKQQERETMEEVVLNVSNYIIGNLLYRTQNIGNQIWVLSTLKRNESQ